MTGLTANGSQSYQQDKSSPQINGSLNGSTGANGWYISDVSFSASASDSISGLSTFEYSIDNAVWTPYTSLLTLSDGIHTFNLRAVDNAGNQSETSQTFSIDTLTPTLDLSITETPGNGGWYKSNPQVTVTANDSGSGLASFEYNLDNSGWIAYTGALTLIDGAHTLSVRAMDAAGNVTQTDQQIDVDTITPLINISPNGTRGGGGWYISDLKVNASSSDNGAGLASFEYSLNDSTWTPYIGTLPFTEGQHNLKFRAMDNAGNVTTTPVQTYRVDTTPPFIHMPSNLYLGETTQYSVQDHGSQLAVIKIAIEDSNERYGEIAWEEYPSGTTFSDEFLWNGKFKDKEKAAEGTYFETIKASDIAGNQSIMTGSIIVESDLLSYILPPFVPPVNTPVSIPTSVVPMEESTSFGGEENPIPSSPETAETGIVSVGGEATIATGVTETQSFESQSSTSSQSTNLPNSNILWGAVATAAVGAFVAEAQRKKREEEEAQRKKKEEEQAQRKKREEEEVRAMQKATRQADGPSRSKQYREIGKAYAAAMKVKKQNEEIAKQKRDLAVKAKLARIEVEDEAKWQAAEQARAERERQAQKAHDDFRTGERSGDREIVQAWNEQQAASGVAVTYDGLTDKQNKIFPVKSWLQDRIFKPLNGILNSKTAIGAVLTVALGGSAIMIGNVANNPHVFDKAQANFQNEWQQLYQTHPKTDQNTKLEFLYTHPYEAFSIGYDGTKAIANSAAGYIDAIWQQHPVSQALSSGLEYAGDHCPEGVGEAWNRRCSAALYFTADVVKHPADTIVGVGTALVADPVAGAIKTAGFVAEYNNPTRLISDFSHSIQENGLAIGVKETFSNHVTQIKELVKTDPQVQTFGVLAGFMLATIIGLGIPAAIVGTSMILAQSFTTFAQIDSMVQAAVSRAEAMKMITNPQIRRQIATTLALLAMVAYGGIRGVEKIKQLNAFKDSLSPSVQSHFDSLAPFDQIELLETSKSLGLPSSSIDTYLLEIGKPNSSLAKVHVADGLRILNGEVIQLDPALAVELAKEMPASTGRDTWVSPETGKVYVSSSTPRAIAAAKQLVAEGMNGPNARALIRIIAKESIRGSGDRLVLGPFRVKESVQKGPYIQDSLNEGGTFFDMGSNVIDIETGADIWTYLDNNGIDTWLINEEVLRIQTETMNISRVDFVVEDPISVIKDPLTRNTFRAREIKWLMENAETDGYTRVDSSWVLTKP